MAGVTKKLARSKKKHRGQNATSDDGGTKTASKEFIGLLERTRDARREYIRL